MPRFRTLPCRSLPLKRHEARFDAAQARQLKRRKRVVKRVEAGNESTGFLSTAPPLFASILLVRFLQGLNAFLVIGSFYGFQKRSTQICDYAPHPGL